MTDNLFILKIIKGDWSIKDIYRELRIICRINNHNCNESCPVYAAHNNKIPYDSNKMCECMSNGKKMHDFILTNI